MGENAALGHSINFACAPAKRAICQPQTPVPFVCGTGYTYRGSSVVVGDACSKSE